MTTAALLCTHRFMEGYDARLDLAPRDIVARAIHDQMQARGDSHVLLDIRCAPLLGDARCLPGSLEKRVVCTAVTTLAYSVEQLPFTGFKNEIAPWGCRLGSCLAMCTLVLRLQCSISRRHMQQ